MSAPGASAEHKHSSGLFVREETEIFDFEAGDASEARVYYSGNSRRGVNCARPTNTSTSSRNGNDCVKRALSPCGISNENWCIKRCTLQILDSGFKVNEDSAFSPTKEIIQRDKNQPI